MKQSDSLTPSASNNTETVSTEDNLTPSLGSEKAVV